MEAEHRHWNNLDTAPDNSHDGSGNDQHSYPDDVEDPSQHRHIFQAYAQTECRSFLTAFLQN